MKSRSDNALKAIYDFNLQEGVLMNKQQPSYAKRNLKLHEPQRLQVEIKYGALDDCLEHDHKARIIWECVQAMDTNSCFRHLKTMINGRGRKATNPEVLLALWILACTDNISSSRVLVDLTKKHDAYRWICGGVAINHDMLCTFRSLDTSIFEDLCTSCLALMQFEGLLSDSDFAQDGTRIQSAAGNGSGRREKTLLEYKEDAEKAFKTLKANGGYDAKDLTKKQRAARCSAITDRKKRMELAKEELKKAQEKKRQSKRKKKEDIKKEVEKTRISPTDPEARIMKMGGGGFSLAYNTQVVTGTQSRAIYSVSVSNSSDQGKAPKMMAETICALRRAGKQEPKNWICDSGYTTIKDIEGCYDLSPNCNAVFAPKPNKKTDPVKIKRTDGPGMRKWRNALNTEEFKETYSKRCSTVELSNARLKKGGVSRFSLRGLLNVRKEALLAALSHNINIIVNHQKGKQPLPTRC